LFNNKSDSIRSRAILIINVLESRPTSNSVEANKEQLLVDKVTEIQKENRILLKKMLTIDLKPTPHNPQKIKMIPTPSAFSLNRGQRIAELTRVTQQNKVLLQRLQTAGSVYNSKRWEKDFRKKQYRAKMLSKNSDRYCQHPYFVMTGEPRVLSATGTTRFGYQTMPFKSNTRARSNYSAHHKGKRRRRLMTAGHGGRKQSQVHNMPQNNRPITAKAPGLGRFGRKTAGKDDDNAFRPDTVPFTNLGPLGETEPVDEDDRINQEINRESDKEIEDRIADPEPTDQDAVREETEPNEGTEDKFNEHEKKIDNLTESESNNAARQDSNTHQNQDSKEDNRDNSSHHENDLENHNSNLPDHKNSEPKYLAGDDDRLPSKQSE
jgi:hypothetical protein